jgi:hypothetical protein
LPGENLKWNQLGKFKLLGINYDLLTEDKTAINVKKKIEKIRTLLNSCIYWDLTYVGKITVIKSLAMPILIQSLTVLSNPSDKIINEIQNIFYSFLWSGKPDKIKRKVIIGQYEEGGLKMPHIESFCHRLKMVWINKILDPLKIAPWKTLFIDQYNKYGADKIWMLDQYGLSKVASHFNRFWTDIFQNWGKLRERSSESDDIPTNILTQSIWFNKKLKIDNTSFFYYKWCDA